MKVPDYLNGPRSTSETRASSAKHHSPLERTSSGGTPPGEVGKHEFAQHLPAAELADLADQLRELPEVRGEVIARIAERLASGGYLTREAAERVAERLLGAAG